MGGGGKLGQDVEAVRRGCGCDLDGEVSVTDSDPREVEANGGDQYDAFAADYEWLFSDATLSGDPQIERLKPILAAFKDPRILDCSCGTGLAALALARCGYEVLGTDVSHGMLMRAQAHAAEQRLQVSFALSAWESLPKSIRKPVDVAICLGNSLGHCRDESEMLRSLRGMRAVLREGGSLVVESSNWEQLYADRVRFTHFGLRERGGTRCIPLYVWNFGSELHEPMTIEVVLVFEEQGKVRLRTYDIAYRPFRAEELLSLLRQAGFGNLKCDWTPQRPSYRVVAEAVGTAESS
jgi:SAM-dependent methyltransferase